MTTAILKGLTGEAGAGFDESHGAPNRLVVVLQALADSGSNLDVTQATIAAATIASRVVDKATRLLNLSVSVAVCGTAGDTDIDVEVNGTVVATLTVDNADADGIKKTTGDINVAVPAAALVEIIVSAAPTSGTGLVASIRFGGVVPD